MTSIEHARAFLFVRAMLSTSLCSLAVRRANRVHIIHSKIGKLAFQAQSAIIFVKDEIPVIQKTKSTLSGGINRINDEIPLAWDEIRLDGGWGDLISSKLGFDFICHIQTVDLAYHNGIAAHSFYDIPKPQFFSKTYEHYAVFIT